MGLCHDGQEARRRNQALHPCEGLPEERMAAEKRAVLFGVRAAIPGLDQRLQALAIASSKDQAPEVRQGLLGASGRGYSGPGGGEHLSGLVETRSEEHTSELQSLRHL